MSEKKKDLAQRIVPPTPKLIRIRVLNVGKTATEHGRMTGFVV